MEFNINIKENIGTLTTTATMLSGLPERRVAEIFVPIQRNVKRVYGSAPCLHVSSRKQDDDRVLTAELMLDKQEPNKYLILADALDQLQTGLKKSAAIA